MRSAFSILPLLLAGLTNITAMTLSEIMFDPLGNENADEFIELFNNSQFPTSLEGWRVTDGADTDRIVPLEGNLLALPGQYVLILDADYFDDSSTTYDGLVPETALVVTIDNSTIGSRGLSNSTSERVSLLDAGGEVVSSVEYTIGNSPGHSDEKVVISGGDGVANWANSTTLHGTPGAVNSVAPSEFDLGFLAFHANPERPEFGTSFVLEMRVKNFGLSASSSTMLVAEIFDAGADSSVILEFHEIDALPPGDTVSFTSHTLELAQEPRRFTATLSEPDDNPSNNERNLTVSPNSAGLGVVVNEIMYGPESSSEWVELFNTGPDQYQLSGWQFADGDGYIDSTRRMLLPEYSFNPDTYVILASDSQLLFENVPEEVLIFVWSGTYPSLNNSGDSLFLMNETGEIIERIDYRPSWGGGAGVSLERISGIAEGNDPLNWAGSLDSTGSTPGRPNSRAYQAASGGNNILTLSPNPFSPDGNGVDDLLHIGYRFDYGDVRMDLKIYDVRGRAVAELANNTAVGFTGELLWNGVADSGRELPTGMYIVYLQAHGRGGDRIQEAKRVATLVRPE